MRNILIPRRKLLTTAMLGGGAVMAFPRGANADTPFTQFAFPATGEPTARTMPDRLAEIKNVLDFGADPTGATDSYAAIQAAINWTSGANRGTIFFPAGAYGVSQSLTFNYNGALSIRFLGVGATSSSIGFWSGHSFTGSWIFDRSNVNGGSPSYQVGPIVFEGLSVNAQGGASTVGCVRIGSTIGAAFRDCMFSGNTGVSTEDSAGNSSKVVLFENCRFNANGSTSPTNAVIWGGGGSMFNCDLRNNDTAVRAYGSGFVIAGSRMENNNTATMLGKDSGGTNRTTSGFWIAGGSYEGNGTAIDFVGPCSGFYINAGALGHDKSNSGYPLGVNNSQYGLLVRAGNAQAGVFDGVNCNSLFDVAAISIGNASSRANLILQSCNGAQTGSTGVPWELPTNAFTAQFDNCNTSPIWTFSQLPSGGDVFEGDEFNISDSNTATWGATAAGSGSNRVLVRYNGTNWTVVGK
jgi:hypothetical protein